MALSAACLAAAARALGRNLSNREQNEIERGLSASMRLLAARDLRAWLGKSPDQQKAEGATHAATEILQRDIAKRVNIARTIRVRQELDAAISDMETKGINNVEAVQRILVDFRDGKSTKRPLDLTIDAIESDHVRLMLTTLEATNPRFFGLFENKAGEAALAKELGHENSGWPSAKLGAKQYHNTMETMRLRSNAAGGETGKLDNYDYPHSWSPLLTATAGGKTGLAARDVWVQKVWGRLDRRRYVNEDGTFMADLEYQAFLEHAWESIATGGTQNSGINPPSPGSKSGDAHRQLHFKSSADYQAHRAEFSDKSLYDVLVGSMYGTARDIGLMETLGPNPRLMLHDVLDKAYRAELAKAPHKMDELQAQVQRTQVYFDALVGAQDKVDNQFIADIFQTARNITGAAKLGSSSVAALYGDLATSMAIARLDNIPRMRFLRNYLRALNPTNRKELRQARAAGLGLRIFMGEVNRFGQDMIGSSASGRAVKFSNKLISATLRASGTLRLTAAEQRGVGAALQSNLASLTQRALTMARLGPIDLALLRSKGVTDSHWQTWQKATPENWGGKDRVLTPASIYRIPDAQLVAQATAENTTPLRLKQEGATQLLATTLSETDTAVITPSVKQRVQMRGKTTRGNFKDEFWMSLLTFKSFPFSVLTSHYNRIMAQPTTGSKLKATAFFLLANQLAGMAILWTKDLLSGNDPRSYDPSTELGRQNILAGLLAGGGLGIYADFLFTSTSRFGRSAGEQALGPTIGMGFDIWDLIAPSSWTGDKLEDKPADLVRFARNNVPTVRFWYTKAALDHWLFQQMQEAASPGYVRRMRSRAFKNYGTTSWWEPSEAAPDRLPELGRERQ